MLAVGRWEGGLPSLPGGLMWKREGLKYLGVYIGNETIVQKNWEGVAGNIQGRLNKWKWLKPQLSYRGRTLIINNLVASAILILPFALLLHNVMMHIEHPGLGT